MKSQSEMIQEQPAPVEPVKKNRRGESLAAYRKKKAEEKAADLARMQQEERDRFEVNDEPQGKQFIHLGTKIKDKDGHVWHIKRHKVPLTPIVCTVKDCGYDLVREYNLPPWDDEGKQYLIDEREKIMGQYGQYVDNPDFGKKTPNPDFKIGMTDEEKSIALKQFAKHVETHKHEQSVIETENPKEVWPKPQASRLPVGWR